MSMTNLTEESLLEAIRDKGVVTLYAPQALCDMAERICFSPQSKCYKKVGRIEVSNKIKEWFILVGTELPPRANQ